MVILRHRRSKVNFVTVFTLSTLVSVIYTTKAIPQSSLPNNTSISPSTVRLGIRKVASPVTDFCYEFGKTLKNKQALVVEYPGVVNQYTYRYEGLLLERTNQNAIDIECGPNSRGSENLRDQSGEEFSDKIAFSGNSFHETGTRLLLKKEIAQELTNLTKEQLRERLKTLSIVVASNTTTYDEFKKKENWYQKVSVGSVEGLNDRDRALNALEKGFNNGTRIEAFARAPVQ
ncbi:hypothetical protein [Calothrix sp. PCC 6303]|uniref:hypothetical protein n=1 Tax=Calothrix sp. PCC 6303 TaxID=1170562 RepID=UPI0002A0074F|nr:hypothetical protein [Calothrix sp. PCC 6303]AFZ03028.1 hypothetical protein Cal6303_4114 [Calothrix sp. PCC 6303]